MSCLQSVFSRKRSQCGWNLRQHCLCDINVAMQTDTEKQINLPPTHSLLKCSLSWSWASHGLGARNSIRVSPADIMDTRSWRHQQSPARCVSRKAELRGNIKDSNSTAYMTSLSTISQRLPPSSLRFLAIVSHLPNNEKRLPKKFPFSTAI